MSGINDRVGQQCAIKVISSISGSVSDTVKNVVGGIASVTQLNVSGVSTFSGEIYYPLAEPLGVAYFDDTNKLVSIGTSTPISDSNYLLTLDSESVPVWTNTIDGGEY